MNVLERAEAHYLSTPAPTIEVPEWDCTIHVRPLTISIAEQLAAIGEEGTLDNAIEVITLLAADEHRKPLFVPEDRQRIKDNLDAKVLLRVCAEINTHLSEGEEPGED